MAETSLSLAKEEYEAWVPFAAAYRRLAEIIGYSEARDEFRDRLKVGILNAAALNLVGQAKDHREQYIRLGPGLWTQAQTLTNSDNLWDTSSHTFYVPGGGYRDLVLVCTGIRLDPSDVDQILIDAGIEPLSRASPNESTAAPPTRRQDLPLLPEPIARAWADWFKGQPNASKDAAEKAARHMFPNHNFSRERIRDLLGPSIMGRPPKSKD